MRMARNTEWLPDKEEFNRLGSFISVGRWLWYGMLETSKVMDGVYINCCSLVIGVKSEGTPSKKTDWTQSTFYFTLTLHQAPYGGASTVPLCPPIPSRYFFFIFYIVFHILNLRVTFSLHHGLWSSSPSCMPLANWTVSQTIALFHIQLHTTFPPKHVLAMLYFKMFWKVLTDQPQVCHILL